MASRGGLPGSLCFVHKGWLLLLVLGCRAVDEDLVAQREALDLWRHGREILSDDPVGASLAFRDARIHLPLNPVLLTWEAKALAESGDLVRARVALDLALERDPHFGEARYNRAAYACRAGDFEGAARDLRRVLDDGVVSTREVVEDPDFSPHLMQEAFEFLPVTALQVSVEAPSGTLFWGTEFAVRLRVVGASAGPLSLTAETVSGPVQLVGMVEDTSPSTSGDVRDLTWTFRITGAGEVRLGPLQLWSGERRASLPAVVLLAAAPPSRSDPPPQPFADMPTTGELISGHDLGDVWRVGDEVRILTGPNVPLVRPDGVHAAVFEVRDHNDTTAVLTRLAAVPEPVTVVMQGRAITR